MTNFCYDCDKSYANKASLAAHISRYHRSKDNSNKSVKKVLLPHSAFENNIPQFKESTTKKMKRIHSSDLSEDSDSDNDSKVKRIKTKKPINKESSDEIVQKLINVSAGLIREMKQVSKNFREIEKDMDEVDYRINENKRNRNREIMFKQMDGSGIDMDIKRFYKKIMDENPNLFKDIKETRKNC